jgi:hypothetical protein
LPGCWVKKLNQSLTKFYPGIPDIGGRKTCFFAVEKEKNRCPASRETLVMATIFRNKPEKIA